MVNLLRESGYCEHRVTVNEAALEAHLRSNPGLVNVWVGHSGDQRCTPAYYLRAPDDSVNESGWAVGYVPRSGPRAPERRFPDRYTACAHFIQKYVESLSELL
jgi:hypothetical protein